MSKDSPRTPPIDRYFMLLELLAGRADGLSLQDIAVMAALPKASLHRQLAVMQAAGLVDRADGSTRYTLGDRARRLATLMAGTEFIETVAGGLLRALSREFDETCYMARLEGETVRSVLMESPRSPWRGYVVPGRSMMAHANASAKAIMAHQPPEMIESVLKGSLPALTRFTQTDARIVKQEFETVRREGHATCIDEVEEGLAAFAVPVLFEDGGVRFALATVGPKARILEMIEQGAISRFRSGADALARAVRIDYQPTKFEG
ncbi:IclR family transcriptional regulator [Roseovarius sp. SK2]|uniref:IclR family transcriptional regulator n=1 Tax=Roseovarius sp. SK2 TaxID=3028381 RepID=UPI00237B8046|nr:IclR family transcriptional regulator [Roseovarius sp. SK2]MDD9727714.1 IclR family transcriptional regulator [Roseovarius sp. SK2]